MSEAWRKRLADECRRRSQAAVAELLGYSPTVVNQVLSGSYRGDLTAVRRAVEGAFMGAHVECPVLGEIADNRCISEQRRAFAATNPQRVQLFKACRNGCVHSRVQKGGSSDGRD